MEFNNAAQQMHVAQIEKDFSATLGDILESLKVLSPEQVAQSGMVQAQMIAIRDAIENGDLTEDTALAILGGSPGKINFSKLAKEASDAARDDLLDTLEIKEAHILHGINLVTFAKQSQGSVNQDHAIAVPAIGFIHTDLHAKNISNFGEIKQGVLLSQRAIDAMQAISRLETGKLDAALGAKRGFKLWGDESPELAAIVTTCAQANSYEERGLSFAPTDLLAPAHTAFEAARACFLNAGHPQMAQAIETLRLTHFDAEPVLIDTPEFGAPESP